MFLYLAPGNASRVPFVRALTTVCQVETLLNFGRTASIQTYHSLHDSLIITCDIIDANRFMFRFLIILNKIFV